MPSSIPAISARLLGSRPGRGATSAHPGSACPAAAVESGRPVLWLPSTPDSVAAARTHTRMLLTPGSECTAEQVDDVVLLVSELVTNVVLHGASSRVGLSIEVTASSVRVAVRGLGPLAPPDRATPPTDPERAGNGRGLQLVDAYAHAWGVAQQPDGWETWFLLRLAATAPAPAGPAGPGRPRPARLPRLGRTAPPRVRSLRGQLTAMTMAVLLTLLVGGAALAGVTSQTSAATARRTALGRAILHASQLDTAVVDQESALRGYLLSKDTRYAVSWQRVSHTWPGLYRTALADAALADRPQYVRRLTVQVQQVHQRWLGVVAAELTLARTSLPAAQHAEAAGSTETLVRSMRTRLATLMAVAKNGRDAALAHEDALRRLLLGASIGFAAVLGLVVAAVARAARRLVMRPLRELGAAARSAADGQHAPLEVHGPAEILAVAADVEGMRRQLLDRIREQQRLIDGLRQNSPAVSALQAMLARPVPEVADLVVAGRSLAGEGVLAGDWYDVVALPGDRIGITLGDVAGHGAAPAVTALAVKQALAGALLGGRPPDEALDAALLVFASADRTRTDAPALASAFVAVVDPAGGTLSYANAGHPAAHLRIPGGSPTVELAATGPVLCRLADASRREVRRVPFPPGASLLLYTDGVTEASPPGTRDQYGDRRLAAVWSGSLADDVAVGDGDRASARRRAERGVSEIFADVFSHAEVLRDDATVLLVHHCPADPADPADPAGPADPADGALMLAEAGATT